MASIFHTEMLINQAVECPVGCVIRSSIYLEAMDSPRPHSLLNMRVMGAYSLVYLQRGGGRYVDMRGADRKLQAGDLLLIYPDIGHRYLRNSDEDWKEINLIFNGPVFDLWRRQGILNDSRPVIRLEPVGYWSNRFETLARSSAAQSPLEIICGLTQLLAEINGYEQTRGISDHDQVWLDNAKMLLNVDMRLEDFQLEHIAQQLGDSYVGFRKKFTRLAGTSPAKFHMKVVIERACELIRRKGMTNRQVTERLGFSSEYYFSRRFKQLVGLPPQEFRRQVQFEQ